MTITVASELLLSSTELERDKWCTRLSVPSMHCGGCISKVEKALLELREVSNARVNLTRKSVDVIWSGRDAPDLIGVLNENGHEAHLHGQNETVSDNTTTQLVKALAVAGFAASNIMLMSVAVWSGAEPWLAHIFHWVSATIALPTLLYSGRVFFKSAWSALRHWKTNMDVPISIGVVLAFSMSLFDTINQQGAVYFDASVMLLFFLLIGRTLDHVMREKAQSAVSGLAKLIPNGATVVENGCSTFRDLDDIEVGEKVLVREGERVPLDGRVTAGFSTLDCSMVTGESLPRNAHIGTEVLSGTQNLGGALELTVTASRDESFLSQTVDMMANASSSRSKHQRIADRAAALYAPFVHSAAFLAFIAWFAMTGDWHRALTVAIAVLIITCPCALGLAAPIVQVVASQRLFAQGVLMRDGTALERMQVIDTVIFDKTGTLTEGRPRLLNPSDSTENHLSLAAALAQHSSHPYSRAIFEAANNLGFEVLSLAEVAETPGCGLEALIEGKKYRLGQSIWALTNQSKDGIENNLSEVVLSVDGQRVGVFYFEDELRPSGVSAIAKLKQAIPHLRLTSGDNIGPVEKAARALGLSDFDAGNLPADKVTIVENMTAEGRKVLMVGDGLNDAPALTAAHVSMAPSSAADVGRNNADFVFLNGDLNTIPKTIEIAHRAGRLIKSNFGMAIAYNVLAIPVALMGLVTPMIAAIAMSASSIIVVLNALRLWRDNNPVSATAGGSK